MKCIAAVVMMALAVTAEGSYVPSVYAHHGYGYGAAPVVPYGGPTVVQSNDHHSWAHQAYAHQAPVVAYNSYPYHVSAGANAYDSHWDHHHQVPAVAFAAPVHHSASYVAANRGAVHKAPLPGHIVNQKSLNLAPAPGTW
ncbi:adult cuticle protein 1-like isoform X3 [Ochlerotatus camptorhynchus]|uniref:adult cuticle protein 1-like isoform X3 n=1 Tax=Ochlerotatus camptorhynchus TaxID=644619 RepID=UPI0031DF9170